MVKRSRAVAKQFSSGVAFLMRKNKITVFDGTGKLAARQTLAVEKDGKPVATLKSPHIILATGARARELPGMKADGKLIWTYRDAMSTGDSEIAAGHRLRRHRHRIRQLLPQYGR